MKNVLPFLCTLLLLSCCKDDNPEPGLPPITTTGANTFGCKVDGKVWLPSPRTKGTLSQIEGGIVERYKPGGGEDVGWYDLLIFADRNDATGLSIYLSRINSIGTYPLDKTTRPWPEDPQPDYSYSVYFRQQTSFMTSFLYQGKVQLLRYDTLNKIFSGTFEFKVQHGSDTISITDGRFDIDQNKIN